MEDFFKFVSPNWGAIEIICFLLIFRGINKLQDLTQSTKELAQIISEMQKQATLTNSKLEVLDQKISHLSYMARGYPPPDVFEYHAKTPTNH